MPTYTMVITVETWAENRNEAFVVVKAALNQSKLAKIFYIDAEVTETIHDDEPAAVEVVR